jgi:uncharacterized membrane protein YfcA
LPAAAGVLADVFGSVTGLASLAWYPVLPPAGLPPAAANVTNTVALMATTVGAAGGSRPELVGQGRFIARLCVPAVCGGVAGAVLLLTTPPGVFEKVVPWLVAGASIALLLGPRLRRAAGEHSADRAGVALNVGVFLVAVYSGFRGVTAAGSVPWGRLCGGVVLASFGVLGWVVAGAVVLAGFGALDRFAAGVMPTPDDSAPLVGPPALRAEVRVAQLRW